MAHRIEIIPLDPDRDPVGAKTARRIREDLGLDVRAATAVSVFTIDADLDTTQLADLATDTYCDPIVQVGFVDAPAASRWEFDWLIEVGFRPGVTDNIGRTAREAAQVRLGRRFAPGDGVYTSTQFLLRGTLTPADAERIARDVLANDLIQRTVIVPRAEFDPARGLAPFVPKVAEHVVPPVETIDLQIADDDLVLMSRERTLALSLDEMRVIRDHYRDESVRDARRAMGLPPDRPTDVELELLAQTWSEHCKHKIFAADIDYRDGDGSRRISSLFKTFIQASTARIRAEKGDRDICRSVFTDNAGVIRFTDDWSLVIKVETHNSPSALDPYGGALTGIVGVNRDPFGTGMGAKLSFNTDVFCFATPFWDKPLPPRLLHPKRVLEGVREGVEHGGNKSGIPTINGSIVFDDRFVGKPLVFCGTGGVLPATLHGKPAHEKSIEPGDLAVMVGGRIGADGIHGATFSSEELHEGSPATAVQIGDPITQKRMTDFLLVARDRGYYRFITDNGAGGLASSLGEMARACGGCEIDLEKAPLKYAGLAPWMILLSESQERMSLAVAPSDWAAFRALAETMEVEATIVGRFTDTGRLDVRYEGTTVASLAMEFLHDGVPRMQLDAVWTPPRHEEPAPQGDIDVAATLKSLLARLNICSKEYVVRQYDHEVQAGSVVKPLVGARHDGPSDAAVWRPLLDRDEAVAVSHGICPRYSDIDTWHMAQNAIDEAVRNAVAVGGDPDEMAGLDNFCWCDPVKSPVTPDGEYKLAQLVRANEALYEATVAYGLPCVSGKDSMKNDYKDGDRKISIPPTLLFTVLAKVHDARQAVTMDAKAAGDLVYVLGTTRDETGASEYLAQRGFVGNRVPRVRLAENITLYRALHAAIRRGLVRSAHDCSDGGLAVALAEVALAGDLGLDVNLDVIPTDASIPLDARLFSESAGRFVVTIRAEHALQFETALAGHALARVGEVNAARRLRMVWDGRTVCDEPTDDLRTAWQSTLRF